MHDDEQEGNQKEKKAGVEEKNSEEVNEILGDYLVPFLADWKGYRPKGLNPRWDGNTKFDEKILTALDVKPARIREYLGRMLEGEGKNGQPMAALSFRINPYETSYRFEFRQALSISLSVTKTEKTNPQKFVDDLITRVNDPKNEKRDLIILDGITLCGAPYDVLLTLISKNGIDDVTVYENTYLAEYPFVTQILTWPVSYTYRWRHGRMSTT